MDDLVNLLSVARFSRRRIANIPDDLMPADVDAAYQAQHALTDHWANTLDGYGGYKIACTSEIPQRQLGTDGPFYGRLFQKTIHDSPAAIDLSALFMCVIEPEFGFLLGSDLEARVHTQEEVAHAVAGVAPAIEIVDSRYNDWESVGLRSLIVDNACHGAWVNGPLTPHFGDLASHQVRLNVNGVEVSSGTGAAVLGHPLAALTWLVNKLALHGAHLCKGDWVTTGVVTGLYYAAPGDHIEADFGTLGSVRIQF